MVEEKVENKIEEVKEKEIKSKVEEIPKETPKSVKEAQEEIKETQKKVEEIAEKEGKERKEINNENKIEEVKEKVSVETPKVSEKESSKKVEKKTEKETKEQKEKPVEKKEEKSVDKIGKPAEKGEEKVIEKRDKPVEKKRREERIAMLNIYTTFNNTIMNLTDLSGNSIAKYSGGQSTKQDRLKANPTIAMFMAQKISEEAKDNGITGFYVKIRSKTGQNNPGPGAHAAIKSLTRAGFKILSIMDTTKIARGGPKKKGGRRGRRV